jgi:hypothetical protein
MLRLGSRYGQLVTNLLVTSLPLEEIDALVEHVAGTGALGGLLLRLSIGVHDGMSEDRSWCSKGLNTML